jgi:hypothetical protein
MASASEQPTSTVFRSTISFEQLQRYRELQRTVWMLLDRRGSPDVWVEPNDDRQLITGAFLPWVYLRTTIAVGERMMPIEVMTNYWDNPEIEDLIESGATFEGWSRSDLKKLGLPKATDFERDTISVRFHIRDGEVWLELSRREKT